MSEVVSSVRRRRHRGPALLSCLHRTHRTRVQAEDVRRRSCGVCGCTPIWGGGGGVRPVLLACDLINQSDPAARVVFAEPKFDTILSRSVTLQSAASPRPRARC